MTRVCVNTAMRLRGTATSELLTWRARCIRLIPMHRCTGLKAAPITLLPATRLTGSTGDELLLRRFRIGARQLSDGTLLLTKRAGQILDPSPVEGCRQSIRKRRKFPAADSIGRLRISPGRSAAVH